MINCLWGVYIIYSDKHKPMTIKNTGDIIVDLLNIINPLMIMITHYDMLSMFMEDCNYDGLTVDETLDYINDYYELYIQAETPQQKEQIRRQCQQDNINPIYLSEFFITYSNELETIITQTPEENKEYMKSLEEEMNNPTELIANVKEYAKNL